MQMRKWSDATHMFQHDGYATYVQHADVSNDSSSYEAYGPYDYATHGNNWMHQQASAKPLYTSVRVEAYMSVKVI